MKKLLIPILMFIWVAGNAQGNYFKFDAGIGGAMTLSNFKAFGVSASTEPKWFFTETISAGLRIEGNVLFAGSIESTSEDFSVGLSSRTAYLVKGEYYFIPNKVRPFVGIGAGLYSVAAITASSTGDADVSASVNTYGFAPEVGVTFKNFRISALYHIVPGTDIYSSSSGVNTEISRNYLVIQLGFKIFEVGKK